MKDVQETVKVSEFRQHLFAYLDACKNAPLIVERGKERYRVMVESQRTPLGNPPLPHLVVDPELLPEFSPAAWQTEDHF